MRKVDLKPFIGIPFVNRGRTLMGADCWGLVRLVFEAYGVNVPDYRVSCFASTDIDATVEGARNQWQRLEKPEPPCLIVMKGIDPDAPQACSHLGVYVGEGRMIHTFQKTMSCLERIKHPYFGPKIEGYYVLRPV
jgi:cell wall-associated NlpC family hydrolase